MTINLADKKRFLSWFVSHISFSRREVSWILNYLSTHESTLKHVSFVENAAKTPRGICINGRQNAGEAITLFVNGNQFTDSDQIFHEIRLNWQKPLYLECSFQNCWSNDLFLAVLEDNPYARWNESLDEEMVSRVNAYFSKEEIEGELARLHRQIDQALEKGEQQQFLELSAEVNKLLEKKALVTK